MSSLVPIGESPWFDAWLGGVSPAAAAAAKFRGSKLTAPATAEPARTLRRVGGDDVADIINLLGGKATLAIGVVSRQA